MVVTCVGHNRRRNYVMAMDTDMTDTMSCCHVLTVVLNRWSLILLPIKTVSTLLSTII